VGALVSDDVTCILNVSFVHVEQYGILYCLLNISYHIFLPYAHWHTSTVAQKYRHLADCKLSKFIKKIHFVSKRARVTNVLAGKQQMAQVVCHVAF
jgi:hypothetical protein